MAFCTFGPIWLPKARLARWGRSNPFSGTSPACTFVNGPLYGTKKQAPFMEQKKQDSPARARAAPLLESPQCRSKILLLMAAKAAVPPTAAASNETTALANADIPTGHRHKHERHKHSTSTAQAQGEHTSNQPPKPKRPATEAASHRSGQPPKRPATKAASNQSGQPPKQPATKACCSIMGVLGMGWGSHSTGLRLLLEKR